MNTETRGTNSSAPAGHASSHGAAGVFGLTLIALGAVAAIFFLTHLENRTAGAREPVEVALLPDATAPIIAAALAADEKPEPGTGTFKGVVTFKGTPPKPKVVVTKGDAKVKPEDRAVCAADELLGDELLVNEKADNAVANVVVYLRKAPEGYKAPPPPDEPAVFDQKGCRFIPHVLVLRCDQKLLIKSGDPITHNTNIAGIRNSGFNQAIAPSNRDGVAFGYKKPESVPVPVKCDFHPWMKAYHLPLDHPFATVTDDEGKFEIKGLPPGKYTFLVWHESPGYLNNKLAVEIKADKVTEQKLSFTAAQFKVGN